MHTNLIIGMINSIIAENTKIIVAFQQSSSNEQRNEIHVEASNLYSFYQQMLDKVPSLLTEANGTIFREIWGAFSNNLECLKDYTKTTSQTQLNDIIEKLNVRTFEYVTTPEQKKKELIEINNHILGLQQIIPKSANAELYNQMYKQAFDTYESSKKYLQDWPDSASSLQPELDKLITNLKGLQKTIKRVEFPIIARSPEWYKRKAILGNNSDYEIVSSNLKGLREEALNLQKALNQNENKEGFTAEHYLFGSCNSTKVFCFENANVLFYINVPDEQQSLENSNIVCGFTPKDEQGRYFRNGIQFDFNYQDSFTSFYTNDKGNLEDNYIEPRYWEKDDEDCKIIYFDPAEGRCACKSAAYMVGGLNPNGYLWEESLAYKRYIDTQKIAYLESPFNVFTNYKDYETAIDVLTTNIEFFRKNWASFCASKDSKNFKSL